jgi:hypothetical protein
MSKKHESALFRANREEGRVKRRENGPFTGLQRERSHLE